ncbi:MAG: hypothetical protein A2015_09085 [Spirochaetes bacterium GWF1_31_7]|nr:MAG: hypothetical protein A2Y30_09135 [Spirochaetes bacterium GWE1_32_154]OHD46628.1 MAG: hypothetical protein A2Y29_07720 [Spirochaetes bacterium GWE2_31_10]OHD47642.1 MAG: hypothetical protein A2015_09085 [Spirochaetes bacterium GWF1_31_7]HBD94419.1 hypothetical protein [Spirochaetia bacterium]HBI37664.1 hypothetical protein [Spirochaetia bacterium]
MKQYSVMLFLLIASFSISSNVLKVEKIGIVNLQKVIEVCFQGKSSAVKQVIEEKAKFQQQLDSIRTQVSELQNSLNAESNTTLKSELESKIEKLRQEYTDLYKKRAPEIDRMEKSIQAPLFEEIYEVVKKIAEREGFSIIIRNNSDTLFYYSIQSDITDKIIEHFNNN